MTLWYNYFTRDVPGQLPAWAQTASVSFKWIANLINSTFYLLPLLDTDFLIYTDSVSWLDSPNMLHFVENKSYFKDLNRESTPYVSWDSDVQYEDIMQVTATYCLSEPTLNIIDFIQFIHIQRHIYFTYTFTFETLKIRLHIFTLFILFFLHFTYRP